LTFDTRGEIVTIYWNGDDAGMSGDRAGVPLYFCLSGERWRVC
jgi:hypothetical protein